jgi:hypothetical protein
MKIAALMMFFAGMFFLWAAFRTYFLKRRPPLLKMAISSSAHGGRFSAFAAYYLGCAVAAIYFSALFYRGSEVNFIVIPVICASLILWRQILLRRT